MTVDSILNPGERIVWADRASPSHRRYVRVRFFNALHLRFDVQLALYLAMGTPVAVFFVFVLPSADAKWLSAAAAVLLAGSTFALGARILRKVRKGEPADYDYILTNQRLICFDQRSRHSEAVALERIASLEAEGDTLKVRIKDPDDEYELLNLADINAAKRAITQAMTRSGEANSDE